MSWIKCSDQMPPEGKRILLCDEYGWIFTGFYEPPFYENTAGDEVGCTVTHWQELPDLP